MPVTIESAGSHVFDLGHIRRQGGEELIRLLLEKAGLHLHLPWRVQVQKKLNCNAETPPVRVVDEPKKWTVHLKIKPGDNNTCHYCSLLMPDGLRGHTVYYLLGKASAELDRNWRNRIVEPTNGTHGEHRPELFPVVSPSQGIVAAPPLPPVPDIHETVIVEPPLSVFEPERLAPAEAPEPTVCKTNPARGWLSEPEKARLLVLAIHEINESGAYSQDHWVELLIERMSWEGANRHEVGGVLTSLVRKGLIERRYRGSKPYGYLLAEEGRKFIADLIRPSDAPPTSAPLPPPPSVAPSASRLPDPVAPTPRTASDPAAIIRSFGPVAKQFLDANARLEDLARREGELIAELDLLREERDQICGLLGDNRVQSVLASLARLLQPKG